MKKVLRKFMLLVLTVTLFGASGTNVFAASGQKSFETIILEDCFKFSDTQPADAETFKSSMILVDSYTEDLGDGLYMVIEDYTDNAIQARATVKVVEKVRHCYVKNKRGNVLVQFSLHGKFAYDGIISSCTDTKLNVYNNASNTFTITKKTHYKSGKYAVANCATYSKATKKTYSKL